MGMDIKSKILLITSLLFILLGSLFIIQAQSIGKLRLVFCDVGQGDGMLLISPGGNQVVVDGGPGRKMVDCLSSKMPFWDRKIELMVSTHAQKDHMEGLIEVLGRYEVGTIVTTGVENDTEVYRAWEEAVKKEGARIYTPVAGDKLMADKLEMMVLWPSFAKASEGKPSIEEWRVNPPKDLNESSIVAKLEYGGFCAYLTGDIPKEILQLLIDTECELLKVSHHGSKTGTNKEIVDLVNPAVAVIQVGKNSFGHPTKEVLNILESKGVKILRNDTNGIIEVESDGKSFRVKVDSQSEK